MNARVVRKGSFARGAVLSKDEIERIHEQSLRVLAEVGIVLQHPLACQIMREAGAVVDDQRQLVRISRPLVEQALKLAPHSFTLRSGGDRTRDCHFGPDSGVYARTSSGLNFIIDARSKRRREVNTHDAVAWARITHDMTNLHVAGGLFPWTTPAWGMEVRAVAILLEHTDKPIFASGVSGEGMRWIHRLVTAVNPKAQPRLTVLSSVNNPLIYEHGQIEAALVAAELGIPVYCNSSAVAGASAPITLAGDLVQMNAEMLAAITLIQLHHPGAPVIYGGHPLVMDMRTGLACAGLAEGGLLASACIDLGRYFGLPTGSNGLTSDSPLPDASAAIDKLSAAYLALLAGANLNGGAGSIATISTASLEQLIIDNDIFGRLFRQVRGIDVERETLAYATIARVGPTGTYIADTHTYDHMRREYAYSRLGNRLAPAAWEAAGGKDIVDRANEHVQGILAAPAEPVLDAATVKELRALANQAQEDLAVRRGR